MSTYEYYEFQTIDKPLTDKDKQDLRSLSTRARITSTSFVNEYNWGNFGGSPLKLMKNYFDAFLYVANWGMRRLMLRIPRKLIDVELARKYFVGLESATLHDLDDYLIFEFCSDKEEYEWIEEDEYQLSSLISLRSDLIRGDYRCLYLFWLFCVEMGEVKENSDEPPVPANLNDLNAPLKSFVDFMRIDTDLIEAAAENSMPEKITGKNYDELESWVERLPEHEKNEIIFCLIYDNDPHLGTALMQRFKKSTLSKNIAESGIKSRKVQELIEKAGIIADERERLIKAQEAIEKVRKAEAREKYLNGLEKREVKTWQRINALIETKKQSDYDEAVQLMVDLRDISMKKGNISSFKEELQKIKARHGRKPSLTTRLKTAGLIN